MSDKTKKLSVKEMLDGAGDRNGTERRGGRAKPVVTPVDAASRVGNRRSISDRLSRQKREFRLPSSGEVISLELKLLDPNDTYASPLNSRVQSLLSLEDEEVKSIFESMAVNGQLEPCYARKAAAGSPASYEVLIGSTRRFCAIELDKLNPEGFPLLAWVGDIGDTDAEVMADEENSSRRDLSLWEKAKQAERRCRLPGMAELTATQKAERLKVGRTMYYTYETIWAIPEALATKLSAPALITKNVATPLKKILTKLQGREDEFFQVACKTASERRITSTKEFVDLLNRSADTFIDKPVSGKRTKLNGFSVTNRAGVEVAKVTPHRTKAGQVKIDLYNISNQKTLEDISSMLGKLLQES